MANSPAYTPAPQGADHENLSASRSGSGETANGTAIPAVDPHGESRSDNAQATAKDSRAELGTPSRRGFIMNTIVSAAAVASATAVHTPLLRHSTETSDLAHVSPDLRNAANAINEAYASEDAASVNLMRCRRALDRWLRRNPEPTTSDTRYMVRTAECGLSMIQDYPSIVAQDRDAWFKRKIAARKQSGVHVAEAAASIARDALTEKRHEFSKIKPRSLADLLFAARVSYEYDNAAGTPIIALMLTKYMVEFAATCSVEFYLPRKSDYLT